MEGFGHRHRTAADLLADLETERYRLVHRHRADDCCGGAPVEDLEDLSLVAGAQGVLSPALPRLVGLRGLAADPGDRGLQAPGSALAGVILVRVEDVYRSVGDTLHVVDRASMRLEPYELLLDPRARFEELVCGALDCLGQNAVGVG